MKGVLKSGLFNIVTRKIENKPVSVPHFVSGDLGLLNDVTHCEWLENLGKKIFEWHFCVEWWKILDSLSFDRKFLTQLNYNLEKFLIENFWLRRWKFLDRKFWINVFNGCTIFDNQTIEREDLGWTILYIPKFYKVISSKGGTFYTFKNPTRSSAQGVENFIRTKIL